jgi:hypothetical protein
MRFRSALRLMEKIFTEADIRPLVSAMDDFNLFVRHSPLLLYGKNQK